MWFKLIFVIISWSTIVLSDYNDNEVDGCYLPENLVEEIKGYQSTVNEIIKEAIEGNSKGFVYDELSTFVDKFGNRLAGTTNLENAIDYMLDKLKKLGLDNVHGEIVAMPRWVRYVIVVFLLQVCGL